MAVMTPTTAAAYVPRPTADEHSKPVQEPTQATDLKLPEVAAAMTELFSVIGAVEVAAQALEQSIYPVCAPFPSLLAVPYNPPEQSPYSAPMARILFEYTERLRRIETELIAATGAVQI